MKNILIIFIILISFEASAQNTGCSNIWLGDPYDSISVIKQAAQQYLQSEMQLSDNGGSKTVYEMKDKDELSLMKVWMKQKRVVAGGNMTINYVVNSFRITGLAENIEKLFKDLKQKVVACTTESSNTSVIFTGGKISVENQGGGETKKNIPLSTLTVASAK